MALGLTTSPCHPVHILVIGTWALRVKGDECHSSVDPCVIQLYMLDSAYLSTLVTPICGPTGREGLYAFENVSRWCLLFSGAFLATAQLDRELRNSQRANANDDEKTSRRAISGNALFLDGHPIIEASKIAANQVLSNAKVQLAAVQAAAFV